ncbi:HAD family hydrolase, partial [Pseudomonas aeruginosa]|uniref:HAD family hydrolase n=1 Tax=Pseudomonas aeruginosa TaxID=287 RepID=UPI003CF987D6
AEALERAHAVNRVVFDKTGTLTSGSPRIVHSRAVVGDQAQLLQLAGALQRGSELPLAKAVLDACEDQSLAVADINNSQSLTGRGIAGSL